MSQKNIIVTAALPYANGPIHLGHLVEYIQADMWSRFQRAIGNNCLYFCADDCHGTPILVRARSEKISPESLIEKTFKEHTSDFKAFQIEFDHYSSTHSNTNKHYAEFIYGEMKKNGNVFSKNIDQTYCEHDKMFLPDRFIKGTCPKCKSENQYGDSCDKCGATYSPTELVNAQCTICGNAPTVKKSEHIFFDLAQFKNFLKSWVPQHTMDEVTKKLSEWIDGDLKPWDISRDEPYFGFEIPGSPGKFFYVWLDAPIGYVSTTAEWCKKNNRDFDQFWSKKHNPPGAEKSEIYHFIGKDIIYFHCLFWPAMLETSGFRTPTHVFTHGFLTINGEKMSKSKGTFITAKKYSDNLDPSYLRYYYACKFNDSLDDIDLSIEDFVQRVNSDLIGKIINLGSRSAQLINKNFANKLNPSNDFTKIYENLCLSKFEEICKNYEKRNFSKVINLIREIADRSNEYFDTESPWKTIKTDPNRAHEILSNAMLLFRFIINSLAPILPEISQKVSLLFGENNTPLSNRFLNRIPFPTKINTFEHLLPRIELDKVKSLLTVDTATKTNEGNMESQKISDVEISDFDKIHLLVAKVLSASKVEGATKLLNLKLDVGDGRPRDVFSGIAEAYKPEELNDRLVLYLSNLKPRKFKFGISEGMILCAGGEGKELFLLSPDPGSKPGQRVK